MTILLCIGAVLVWGLCGWRAYVICRKNEAWNAKICHRPPHWTRGERAFALGVSAFGVIGLAVVGLWRTFDDDRPAKW